MADENVVDDGMDELEADLEAALSESNDSADASDDSALPGAESETEATSGHDSQEELGSDSAGDPKGKTPSASARESSETDQQEEVPNQIKKWQTQCTQDAQANAQDRRDLEAQIKEIEERVLKVTVREEALRAVASQRPPVPDPLNDDPFNFSEEGQPGVYPGGVPPAAGERGVGRPSPEMQQFLNSPQMAKMNEAVAFMEKFQAHQAADVQARENAAFQKNYFDRVGAIADAYEIQSPSKAMEVGHFVDLVNAKLCKEQQRTVSLEETADFITREYPEHCGKGASAPSAKQRKNGTSAPQILPSGGGNRSPKGDGSELFTDDYERDLLKALS